jgi:hypothetical protein
MKALPGWVILGAEKAEKQKEVQKEVKKVPLGYAKLLRTQKSQ